MTFSHPSDIFRDTPDEFHPRSQRNGAELVRSIADPYPEARFLFEKNDPRINRWVIPFPVTEPGTAPVFIQKKRYSLYDQTPYAFMCDN